VQPPRGGGGNSDALADAFCEGARSADDRVRLVDVALRDFSFAGCTECHGCDTTGVCVVRDDFLEHLLPRLGSAAAVALATPVFFMGWPSQAKAMIDRCQCVWARHWLLGSGKPAATRPGYLLAAAATGFGHTFEAVKIVRDAFFLVLGIESAGELLAPKIDAAGEAAADAGLLARARELGEQAARDLPTEEPRP